jgi:glutamine cyclotransferase
MMQTHKSLRWASALVLMVIVSACSGGWQSPATPTPSLAPVSIVTVAARASGPTPTPPVNDTPEGSPTDAAIPVYSYRVVHSYPHDPNAFTEGLVFFNGDLYESTGLLGRSSLRRVALETGVVLQSVPLDHDYFGEGLTVSQGRLIQLTWQSHTGFVYGLQSFKLLRQFSYPTEGWGLTQDGRRLILSDGTSTLRFLDPETLTETGHLEVRANGDSVYQINELEYVEGEIYANIWKTDRIARINPQTGQVVGWVDLSGLISPQERPDPEAVLNGIAYDANGHRLFVTEKLWPRLFEIALTPPAAP